MVSWRRLQDTIPVDKKYVAARSETDGAYEFVEFLSVNSGTQNIKITLNSISLDGYDEMGKLPVSQKNVADIDPAKLYLLKPVLIFIILALEFVRPGVASL